MTDTITPASLRAHADWLLATHGDSERLAGQLRSAANKLEIRLEAESARDEEAEQLAKAIWIGGPRSAAYPWERLSESSKGFYRIQARSALDFLAADGRLLPEGAHCPNCLVALVGVEEEDTPPAVSVPDSGPDGTPEKPWPTWQDVPDGVVYRGARDTSGWGGWFNRGGARRRFFDGALSKNTEAMIADEAPFVRVDGDKA